MRTGAASSPCQVARAARAACSRAVVRSSVGGGGVRTGQPSLGEELAVGQDPAGGVGAEGLGEFAGDGGVGGVVQAELGAGAEHRLAGDADVVPAQHPGDDVDAVAAAAA